MSSVALERETVSVLPKSGPKLGRKRLALSGAALIVGLGGAWYGYDWWTVGRFIQSTDDAYVGGDITVIAPKVAGFIADVAVTDNQAVHAGDLLVKLDDRDYRAALAKAVAAVAGQQATLANLDATRRLQQAIIAQAQAGIAAEDAEIVRSRDDQVRYRQLSASSFASVQAFQKADSGYKQALAGGQRARAVLDAAQRQLDVIDTQKQQAQAALAGAVADRDTARLNLGYTELRAPIDGTVGNRSARTGAFATVGAQLIAIVPAQGLWVDANFKENQLAYMRAGLPVRIEADVLPGEVFHGHVVSLAPATGAQFSVLPPENATGNFTKIVQRVPVRILLDGDASKLGRLRPGLSVTADIDEHPTDRGSP
jgi:membrane fusion protein (multidrug efflux system)